MGYSGTWDEERTIAAGQTAAALQGIEHALNAIQDALEKQVKSKRYQYITEHSEYGSTTLRIDRDTGQIEQHSIWRDQGVENIWDDGAWVHYWKPVKMGEPPAPEPEPESAAAASDAVPDDLPF